MTALMMATALALGALPAQEAVSVIDFHTAPPGVFASEVQEDGYI